jgi:hypothetical protein
MQRGGANSKAKWIVYDCGGNEEAHMPVLISDGSMPAEAPRSRSFNAAVRELRPVIAVIRKEGHESVEAIMNALNAGSIKAPNGKKFSYGTTYRVLRRLEQLRLADGPRSIVDVASRPRRRRIQGKLM